MPALLDDPTAPTIYRTSGALPYPDSSDPHPPLPTEIVPRHVTLRDRLTVATVLPFASQHEVPPSLLAFLCELLNKEIENGDTYPMTEGMSVDKFSTYWFQNFGAIMLLGNLTTTDEVLDGQDWATQCLGSFYIKPNYPGRSSHVCNGGFLVNGNLRNRGIGRLLGEAYLDWSPKLGYTYSVFNLVYETNVASCRIWDALGFKRIGRVKGCGALKSFPDQLIDAIIYGRDLGPEGEDFVSEERFDKIKFYLKYGKYPNGADRAEKSRLRSAATHYKLLDGDRLMLKDKEVISDPQRQYEIARSIHAAAHAGINKTTATIAERFHWVRIKETASLVIRNCPECKETGKVPFSRGGSAATAAAAAAAAATSAPTATHIPTAVMPYTFQNIITSPRALTAAAAAAAAHLPELSLLASDGTHPHPMMQGSASEGTAGTAPPEPGDAGVDAGDAGDADGPLPPSPVVHHHHHHHHHVHHHPPPPTSFGDSMVGQDYFIPLDPQLEDPEFVAHGDLDMLIE